VEIDRRVVSELGVRVDPTQHEVRVDGQTVRPLRRVYFAVNKPIGFVTTNRDPSRRPRVIDLVRGGESMFAVGRLDMSSSGLILVTNDGNFANCVAHPRYGVEKTYRVVVAGVPAKSALETLRRGTYLAEGPVRVVALVVKAQSTRQTTLEIVLNEGRNRELRRMFARIGNKVLALQRIAIGILRLGDLPLGAHRALTRDEVRRLMQQGKRRDTPGPRRLKTRASSRRKQGVGRSSDRRPTKVWRGVQPAKRKPARTGSK
jgi:23S rRNA pseudouridine2605 synthase